MRLPAALATTLTFALAALAPGVALAADPGEISGEVTAAVGGGPLEGVRVCAYGIGEAVGEYPACEETDADGAYALAVEGDDEYRVEFWPADHSVYIRQYYDGVEWWEEAELVEVQPGEAVAGIDAEMLVGGSISGTVTAADTGLPLADVWVCTGYAWSSCVQSDSGGGYEVYGLPPGDYLLEFFAGWSARPDLARQFYPGVETRQEAERQPLALGEGLTGIDAELTVGASIEGTVRSQLTGGPLAWVDVCTVEADDRLEQCVNTDLSGRYRIEGLSSGTYRVGFSIDFGAWFEEPGWEDDGYETQFFDGATTLAAATSLALDAPDARTGVDALLAGPGPWQPPEWSPPAAVSPLSTWKPPRVLKCRKGFKKKKVKGKQRCVKVRKGKGKGRVRGHS